MRQTTKAALGLAATVTVTAALGVAAAGPASAVFATISVTINP